MSYGFHFWLENMRVILCETRAERKKEEEEIISSLFNVKLNRDGSRDKFKNNQKAS